MITNVGPRWSGRGRQLPVLAGPSRWTRRRRRPAVAHRRLLVTIVGVTPAAFFGVEVGRTVDVFIPERLAGPLSRSPFDDDNAWLNILVRVKPGVSVGDANARLRAAQPAIRAASTPKSFTGPRFLADPLTLEPAATGQSPVRERLERPAFVLFVVAALVLLMACVNIANLLLARSVARRHELSVRVALGASRGRLVRHLLAESLVLAVCGAAVGLVLTPGPPERCWHNCPPRAHRSRFRR